MREHILVLSWLFLAIPCQARTITVKSDGSGDYPTIQAAIDAAVNGDTVVVNPGTYTGDGNRDIDFKAKAITVRSTDPNDPNIIAATIIDCNGTEANLHRGFIFQSGEDQASIVEGFTIRNGYAYGGGGIYCKDSSPSISNCIIIDNKTTNGSYDKNGGDGAGIYLEASSSIITKCLITNNTCGRGITVHFSGPSYPVANNGGNGGGIFVLRSSAIIRECTISNNTSGRLGYYCRGEPLCLSTAAGKGAGIYSKLSLAVIESCLISDNKTDAGIPAGHGAGICLLSSEAVLSDCHITNNRTNNGWSGIDFPRPAGDGGGIYCSSCSIDMSGCVLASNYTGHGGSSADGTTTLGGKGAGICAKSSSKLRIINCFILNNETGRGAKGEGSSGGDGGGIYAQSCDFEVVNSCIMANVTGKGGDSDFIYGWAGRGGNGAGIWMSSGTISNCTIVGNVTGHGGIARKEAMDGQRGSGGGVYSDGDVVIIDSIIWANSPDGLFGVDCNNASYCDIQHANCTDGVGNISVDPKFIQPGYWADAGDPNIVVEPNDPNAVWIMGDYHLSQKAAGQTVDSPCVDAGSDLAVNSGMDRLTTRTDKVGDEDIVDMGYHYCENIADLNDDGRVDVADLAILASQWQQGAGIPSADIAPPGGDGLVDDRDLRLLAENWLWQG